MRGGRPRRHPIRDKVRAVLRAHGIATPARIVWNALRKRKDIVKKISAYRLQYVDDGGDEHMLGYAAFQKLVSEEKTHLRRAR